MLQATSKNEIPFKYVLDDLWFAFEENLRFGKLDLKKEFIIPLKSNRKVALSEDDEFNGKYQRIDHLAAAAEHDG